jgi:hypothetical protein
MVGHDQTRLPADIVALNRRTGVERFALALLLAPHALDGLDALVMVWATIFFRH